MTFCLSGKGRLAYPLEKRCHFVKFSKKARLYVARHVKKLCKSKKKLDLCVVILNNLFTLKLIPIESNKGLCEEPLISLYSFKVFLWILFSLEVAVVPQLVDEEQVESRTLLHELCCYLSLSAGEPSGDTFVYLDAVEHVVKAQ